MNSGMMSNLTRILARAPGLLPVNAASRAAGHRLTLSMVMRPSRRSGEARLRGSPLVMSCDLDLMSSDVCHYFSDSLPVLVPKRMGDADHNSA